MRKCSNIITVILTLLFVLGQIVRIPNIIYLYSFLTVFVVGISLIYSSNLTRTFGLLMIVIGSAIMFTKNEALQLWMDAITNNLALASLIIFVPILGIPISIGKYHDRLAHFAVKYNGKSHLMYLFISFLYLIFAPLVNLGSIHIIDSMLKKLKLPKDLLGRAYVRGFTSVHAWSPYFASVYLVVFSLGLSLSQYLPYGLILGFFQVLVGYLVFVLFEQKYIEMNRMKDLSYERSNKIIELFILIFLLLGTIFVMDKYVDMNASALIIIIVAIFSIAWSLLLDSPAVLMTHLRKFVFTNMPFKANEISLLLTAGFFSTVLSMTSVTKYVNLVWGGVADKSIFLVILFTIAFVSVFSFFGVHQIVTISAIIATVSFEQFGIHIITMAMMLLSSWAIATTVSLVSPVNIIIANMVKANILKVIFKWNFLYSILITLVHTFIIYFIQLIFL